MSEKSGIGRKLAAGGLSLAVLAGCAPPNYEGVGNDFRVAGVIHGIEGDGTINIDKSQLRVLESAGKAATWFEVGRGRHTFTDIHYFEPSHNVEEGGWFGECEHEVPVGRVFNVEGTEMTVEDLKEGQTVIIEGDIRDSSYKSGDYCDRKDRPVYKDVSVTYKPLEQIE